MRTARRARWLLGTLAVVGLLTAGACGSSKKNDTGESGTTATTASTGTSATSASTAPGAIDTIDVTPTDGIDIMEGANTDPKSGPSQGFGHLRAVRAARQEGYDRVVFEFTDAVPGYDVRYVDKPVLADASGEEVPVAGNYVVEVRMEPASSVDLTQSGEPNGYLQTYTGPTRFTPGTPEVTELVQSGDFEAVLHWAIGLTDKVDFRVTTLHDPARLVIDFRNH